MYLVERMIAVGGSIGTGLFIGSGGALRRSVFALYTFRSLLICLIQWRVNFTLKLAEVVVLIVDLQSRWYLDLLDHHGSHVDQHCAKYW